LDAANKVGSFKEKSSTILLLKPLEKILAFGISVSKLFTA